MQALRTAGASAKILELLERKAPAPPPKLPGPVKEERKPTGVLRLRCEPVECEVAVAGAPFRATTDGMAVVPTLGEVTVDFRKTGYLSQHRSVVVSPDREAALSVKLEPDAETRMAFGTRLLAGLMNASGRGTNPPTSQGLSASGSATIFDAGGSATEWNITVLFEGSRNVFDVKSSSGEMKLECRGESCRPQGGIKPFSKHLSRDQMQNLETSLRQFQMYHFSAILDRFANNRVRAVAGTASVPAHGELQLQLEGDNEVYRVSLNSELLPVLVTLDSKTGVGSGLRVAFSDYTAVAKARYPRTTELKLPDGKQGLRVRFERLALANSK